VEVLFNLVWLITGTLLFGLVRHQLRHNAQNWRLWQKYLAVAVLSFMLLPVISITDDLHAMTILAEGERVCRADAANSPSRAALPHFLPAAGSDALLNPPLLCLGRIDAPKDASALSPRFFPVRAGRAPPAYALLNGIA
jgi:hypothetical protein